MKMEAVLEELKNGKVKKMILDTDTYNEVDDQFALAYAMFKTDKVDLLSVNAAPFYYPKLNQKSTSPADGMENSYKEILKIMKLADPGRNIPAYRGSDRFLTSKDEYVQSDACDNIIRTVQESDETVYIVAIGAITNVASALIKCPEIAEKAVDACQHGVDTADCITFVQKMLLICNDLLFGYCSPIHAGSKRSYVTDIFFYGRTAFFLLHKMSLKSPYDF